MICCTNLRDLKPFSSQVSIQDPVTANSVELALREVESYLRRLRVAVLADVQCLCDRIEALEARVTTLETPP